MHRAVVIKHRKEPGERPFHGFNLYLVVAVIVAVHCYNEPKLDDDLAIKEKLESRVLVLHTDDSGK